MRRYFFVTLSLLLICSLCTSCDKLAQLTGGARTTLPTASPVAVRGVTGTISTGKTVAAGTVTVAPSGGSLTVSEPDTPITGLTLTVPADAYSTTKQFKISYAPIESQSFGADLNPATPLISIDNGGAFAGAMMEVTIPVAIPADSFAMGFIYDKATRKLEGMPLLAESATSITVGTCHFTDFLVSLIPQAKLKRDIDSGFRPGIDDWQFTNYGSYISAGGNCAAQSLTALWYYCTQPDGRDLTLYGRYDNNGLSPKTPALEYDDSLGIRFVSTVMKDIDQSAFNYQIQKAVRGVNDALHWNAFAYAIQLTGEPQYVGISASAGGGHAMIVYRIKDGQLYIADPNYPGNTERRIAYANGKFTPYESAATKKEIEEGKSISFESIGYMAKSALTDWGKIAQRWQQMKAGTVGADLFPAYKLVYLNDKGQYEELKDGTTVAGNKVNLAADYNGTRTGVFVFRDGVALQWDANGAFELKSGNNLLGIYVTKQLNNEYEYVDFKYVNVVYGGLTLKPATQEGFPNQNLSFSFELSQPAPSGSKFEWYVDGVLKKTGYDFGLTVFFTDEGTHTIVVKVVDSTGKTVLQAQGTAVIKPRLSTTTAAPSQLALLQQSKAFAGTFQGQASTRKWVSSGETTEVGYFQCTWPWDSSTGTLNITWSGASFSGTKTKNYGSGTTVEEVSGSVSVDGKTLLSLSYSFKQSSSNTASNGVWVIETTRSFSFQNVPIGGLDSARYGPELQGYLVKYEAREVWTQNGQKNSETNFVTGSINWQGTGLQGTPQLRLIFK